MFKSLSLKKEAKEPKDGKDAKTQGAKLGGRAPSFRKSRKGATVTALEAAKVPPPPTPTPSAVRDDGAGDKVKGAPAPSEAPGAENPRHRPTRSVSMTSGGAPIPVGWPLGDTTLRVSVTGSTSAAAADAHTQASPAEALAGLGREAPAESDAEPLASPAPSSSSAAPTPGAASALALPSPPSAEGSQASFARLDALEGEILAKDRELAETRKRHEAAESAIRALEEQWKAEVAEARAELAAASKAKEELESQLAARGRERLPVEAQPTVEGQPGKRSKAEPPSAGDVVKVPAAIPEDSETAEEETGGTGEGGAEGECEGVASPDSVAVLELIQASRSESSPQSKQLVGLRLENVVLKERVADLERDNAALRAQLGELHTGQVPGVAQGAGAAEGKSNELAEKLAAAEVRLAELESANASLLAEVGRLSGEAGPGSMGLKTASLFDLFCAS